MLLSEWAATQPWDAPPIYELRLGPTPLDASGAPVSPRVANMLMRANRYADLIGPIHPYLLVVECKVVADPQAISQLQHYVNLVYASPIWSQYPGYVIQPVLLWAVDDPIVSQMAIAAGIRVVVYTPSWVANYLETKFYR